MVEALENFIIALVVASGGLNIGSLKGMVEIQGTTRNRLRILEATEGYC